MMNGFSGRYSDFRILSGSMLKLFALVAMTLDHLSCFLLCRYAAWRQVLFSFHGHDFSWCTLLRVVGRSAFPLFAFLVVEAYIHTRDRRRYGIGLLLFALISEIPWNLVHADSLLFAKQNVFFTLFLGYIGICAWEQFRDCRWKQLTSAVMLLVVSYFFRADYSYIGFLTILILYFLRSDRPIDGATQSAKCDGAAQTAKSDGAAQGLAVICLNTSHLMCLPASICIWLYNGERGFIRGKCVKYLFYSYYPLHLLVIWFIARC